LSSDKAKRGRQQAAATRALYMWAGVVAATAANAAGFHGAYQRRKQQQTENAKIA